MKIESKLLMINVENDIVVGEGTIKLTAIHQLCFYKEGNGEIECDVDFMDMKNLTFMGMAVSNDYKSFKKFKETMLGMGIDIDDMIDEACEGIIKIEDINKLKEEYKHVL